MTEILNMRADQFMIDGLNELVKCIEKHANSHKMNMIEIGSYTGQSMEIFANTKAIQTIVCIDPWKCGYDESDPASSTNMSIVESIFDKRLQHVVENGINAFKCKGTIDTFVKSEIFLNLTECIDFVYIDGCHTYEAVKHDIEMSINILKPKVAICGHDIHHPPIIRAINELLGNPDKTFKDGSYLKFLHAPV